MIQIDGQKGGGQLLRTALSLAMVTKQPFRISNIRGGRRKPGLMRQHLTCVQAACAISDGSAEGAALGASELVFQAGPIRGGDYQFSIGTAGSTTLLLQTLLPALWNAQEPSNLRLMGGTHNPLAPPHDFIERVFLPSLKLFGVDSTINLVETGFAPVGGGELTCAIEPAAKLQKLNLTDRGELLSTELRVISRGLNDSIASRLISAVQKGWPCDQVVIEQRDEGPGKGIVCLAEARFQQGSEMVCGHGEYGQRAEKIGNRISKAMKTFLDTEAAVGRHLADQLLLPMALAGGGSLTTTAPSSHTRSNISLIEQFLPLRYSITDQGGGLFLIHC